MTKSIVFVRKRERVREVVQWLRDAGIESCYLEGEMAQAKRNEAVRRLVTGQVKVLVATDVASRGLDIDNVSHVFNFDMSRTADVYLHRIGRTGRAGRKGTAISLIEAHDYPLFGKVSRYIEDPIKMRVIDSLRPSTKAPSESMMNKPKPSKKVLAKRKEKKKKKKSPKRKPKFVIVTKRTLANAVNQIPLLRHQLAITLNNATNGLRPVFYCIITICNFSRILFPCADNISTLIIWFTKTSRQSYP